MSTDSNRIELAPGYSISRIVNGCWQLSAGHGRAVPDRRALLRRLLRHIEAGLTTFDCADIYTGVEELLGELLAEIGEHPVPRTVQIHTKVVPDLALLPRLTRAQIATLVDRSLARLGVERLDLAQFHWWDWRQPGWLDALHWLDELRGAGKIRHLGVTNFDSRHLEVALDAGLPLLSNQVQYSLLDRRPERSLSELCLRRGVRLLCYGVLAGGFLDERFLAAPPPVEPLENRSLVKYRLILDELGGWERFGEILEALAGVAEQRGAAVSALAIASILRRPAVAAAIVGVGRRDRLRETLASLSLPLLPEDDERIERILAAIPGPAGEIYELERQPGGRHASIMRYDLNRQGS